MKRAHQSGTQSAAKPRAACQRMGVVDQREGVLGMTLTKHGRGLAETGMDFQTPEIFLQCIFKQKYSSSKAN